MYRRSSDRVDQRSWMYRRSSCACRSTLMDVSTKLGRASIELNDLGMKLVASAPPFKGGPTELVTAPASFLPGPRSLVRAGMRQDAPGMKLPRDGPSYIGAPPPSRRSTNEGSWSRLRVSWTLSRGSWTTSLIPSDAR